MRIAVIGGTGVAGRATVAALRQAGHDVAVLARSRGVDVYTGEGLDEALVGVDVVIDVTNAQAADAEATRNLFATATRNILAAEQRARVKHHALLSIAGLERIEGNAHYAGKRLQEEILLSGPIPLTIQRATQFHCRDGGRLDATRQCSDSASDPGAAGGGLRCRRCTRRDCRGRSTGTRDRPCRTGAAGFGRHGQAHARSSG